ncbi:hypothetical protein MSG28_014095 [Choristoneura fumiferana]|uniref:Uncharacterized protein n=1 Tax=Choristoneura fumiferana TaxID=7141 RepID=A0ACC0JG05_CHOFU|nr:hypothetical protein MSG28_014095 [Choristoneura fumiferana]
MELKPEKRPREDDSKMIIDSCNKTEVDQPQKKKKLNLQEYKLRRSVTSNNSSVTVSPEAIFPDLPSPYPLEKVANNSTNLTPPNGVVNEIEQKNPEAPKKIFDPIREASRKILLNSKKQKAEAMRKRDEDIVMRKIPKVENLELQPLISDAEMLKIVGGLTPEKVPEVIKDKKPKNKEYKELVLVSVGTNTEKTIKQNEKPSPKEKRKSSSPPMDAKALINFKIKKSDAVLKQNVFDAMKRHSPEDKKNSDTKIDKTRFKNITAALKSAEKQVNPKIASNSLFASIQDVVMKKAPEEQVEKPNQLTSKSPKTYRTVIVRDYDVKADHGEDKIILHLSKHRRKPKSASVSVQTEQMEPKVVKPQPKPSVSKERSPIQRQRRDSDMSMSSQGSPCSVDKSVSIDDSITTPKQSVQRSRSIEKRSRSIERRHSNDKRSRSRDKRSRSRGYDKYRRRSRSRSRRRRRTRSRSVRGRRSRSIDRYRRRRRDSPYKRKRTRSPYRRRSPSVRRDYRSNRSPSRSRSRHGSTRSKSPRKSPPKIEKKNDVTYTPPLRKPTISESSDSSSRDSNKPVEERRIVFVGKLEKDSTKASLRASFSKFGHIIEVRLHNKEDG